MSSSSMGGAHRRLPQDLLDQTAQFTEFQRKLNELTEAATSTDGSVTVNVGGQGQLVGVTFHGDRHRDLKGSELGELILATARKAREAALRKVKDLVPTSAVPGLDLGRLFEPNADVNELVGAITEQLTQAVTKSVRSPR